MLGTWLALMAILAWQLPFLISRRQWPELRLFLLLWVIAAVYASLVVADVGIPNTTQLIMGLIDHFLPPP